jgi:hypothetical protein
MENSGRQPKYYLTTPSGHTYRTCATRPDDRDPVIQAAQRRLEERIRAEVAEMDRRLDLERRVERLEAALTADRAPCDDTLPHQ